MNRDWSIATAKATNAIVEGLAFEAIRNFYLRTRQLRINRIDYNGALDLGGKQAFDLIDTYGKKWEVKTDRIAVTTGRIYLEELPHPNFDYLLIFAFFPYVITFQQYKALLADERYQTARGGDYGLSSGRFIPIPVLLAESLKCEADVREGVTVY